MDKTDLVDIVEYAHELWCKPCPARGSDRFKATCRVWWDALGPFDADHVRRALVYLSGEREFIARPAQVARLVIDRLLGEAPVPSADEAWEIWLEMSSGLHHGTAQPTALHPVVAATIKKLKSRDARDRHHFVALYEHEREAFLFERYFTTSPASRDEAQEMAR